MGDKRVATIIDTTLRDGEQAAGVSFTSSARVSIAHGLIAAGVREIEALVPAMGDDEAEEFRLLSRSIKPGIRLIAWNRMLRRDAEASLAAGARTVHLSVPASDLMLEKKLGWTRERALRETLIVASYCRSRGAEVIVGAEDASRADQGFVAELARAAESAGAFRFRYADTLGCQDPFSAHAAVSALAEMTGLQVEYHAHNDLGLATANALAAIRAGAAASATSGGLGERAGNASLEQLAAALALLDGTGTGFDLPRLVELRTLVAKASGRPVPADAPLCGAAAFSHESGIHVDGLLKDPSLYEFVEPARFGRRRTIVPGRHSGRAAIAYCARELGYDLGGTDLERLMPAIRRLWVEGTPADPNAALSAFLTEGSNA